MDILQIIDKLVPITKFNQGQSSKFFQRAYNGESFVVIKNNIPTAVIISPDEYKLLQNLKQLCKQHLSDESDTATLIKIGNLITQIELYDKGDSGNV